MRKKTIDNFFSIDKKLYLLLITSLFYLNHCVIEIPFKPIKVKGIPKYRNIKLEEPILDTNLTIKFNKSFLSSQGKATLNTNYLFLANIKIGSNSQSFNLLLDTGSYILWVPNKDSVDKYKIKNHYNPSQSTTSSYTEQSFEQKYGTGYCSGYYYIDNIVYTDNKKFRMAFGVADKTEFEVEDCDGIIGLAHMYYDESLSFIYMMKNAKVIDSLSFSFKFEGDIDIPMSGKLILGKHKDFSSNSTVTCPLISKGTSSDIYWACQVSSFIIQKSNTTAISNRNFDIIFDTGTNMIMLPLSYYEDLKSDIRKFGCNIVLNDKYYQIECSKSNPIEFKFQINGNNLSLPVDLCYYDYSNTKIRSLVLFTDDFYIFGSPFFLAYHTLFDKEGEKLHFYPSISSDIDYGPNSDDSGPNDSKKHSSDDDALTFVSVLCITIAAIIILAIVGYLIYRCLKWRRAKKEAMDFPSSNYGYNNILI
jgi:DUF2075 family protein